MSLCQVLFVFAFPWVTGGHGVSCGEPPNSPSLTCDVVAAAVLRCAVPQPARSLPAMATRVRCCPATYVQLTRCCVRAGRSRTSIRASHSSCADVHGAHMLVLCASNSRTALSATLYVQACWASGVCLTSLGAGADAVQCCHPLAVVARCTQTKAALFGLCCCLLPDSVAVLAAACFELLYHIALPTAMAMLQHACASAL
jgi:hypothetical protein